MLPAPPQESPRDICLEMEENHNLSGLPDGEAKEKKPAQQTQVFQKETHASPQKKQPVLEVDPEAVNIDKFEGQEVDSNTVFQKKDKKMDKKDVVEKKPGKKTKKMSRSVRVPKKKDKDRERALSEQKVDFPEPLVKAHQAAYAFLNPGITKYDIILELLEEATQTQVSVQPMVAFMALRYEEAIQGLEEMADEGEKVLKDHGDHLAWPSPIKNSSSVHLKASSANMDPPPDLLQQLLQYTMQRMHTVSHTVGRIGDMALEEAVVYFASVSEILMEKIRIKRLVESRLMKLLTRIEMAALRKPGPEDSSLYSEDSGIGAESESLAGSLRQNRRESCGSSCTNSTTLVSDVGQTSMNVQHRVSRQMLMRKMSPSISVTSLNSVCSTGTITANDQRDSALGSVSLDEVDDVDGEELDRGMGIIQVGFLKRSNFSPAAHDQQLNHLTKKTDEAAQDSEMTVRRKNVLSGRSQSGPPQKSKSTKAKLVGSPKTRRGQGTDEEEVTSKKPQASAPSWRATVKKAPIASERRSRSAESVCCKSGDSTLPEKDGTQMGSSRGLKQINKNKASGNLRTNLGKPNQSPAQSPAINRKNVLQEKIGCSPKTLRGKPSPTKHCNKKQTEPSSVAEDKLRENSGKEVAAVSFPPPSPPSSPRPSSSLYRGRNSVKKLIDTFSQGIEGRLNPESQGPLKGVRKCGVPIFPGLGNVEAVLSAGITSCRPQTSSSEKTDDLDLDNLPPPPLEVLMDNSYESAQSIPTDEVDEAAAKVEKSPKFKRVALSQRLRASVTVLPSKAIVPQPSKAVIFAKTGQKGHDRQSNIILSNVQPRTDSGEENNSFHQVPQNIMQQRHVSDWERPWTNTTARNPSSYRDESADTQDEGILSVPENNTTVSTVPIPSVASVTSSQSTITPLSKGRMLPSPPSTSNSVHRRLPSPHNIQRQPSVTSSASSPANRKLPTPPAVQRRLPSPPVAKRSTISSPCHLFKAPSPPASPKMRAWSRRDSSEDSSRTRKSSNVRSLFCPASSSLFEAGPCPVPQPPQAWTSSSDSLPSRSSGDRGRFPLPFHGLRPFIRRSHSDQRPKPAPRPPDISVAETCGSDPAIYYPG